MHEHNAYKPDVTGLAYPVLSIQTKKENTQYILIYLK